MAPRPISTEPDAAGQVELEESISMAFLVVLETLSPAERVAFLLHDVFGYPYPEIADMLERSEMSCRQLVSRARKHVHARRPRFQHDPQVRAEVAEQFLAASSRCAQTASSIRPSSSTSPTVSWPRSM